MKDEFLNLEKQRRTIYSLGRNVNQTPEELVPFLESVIKNTPSAFNSQTTRVVFAFGKAQDKVWDIVADNLKKVMNNDEAFEKNTKPKIDGFKNAFGTLLWFTDTDVVHGLEEQFPAYKENFYDWSEQAQGNAQYAVWTALAENGLGANLQHYNPLIDADIAKEFDIPKNWRLRAQMDFGSIEAPAGDKEFMEDSERFRVFK
ncbi:nitroreductase family protein [Nicoliella spurrieriana]|uniref:Nitroreductase family protein n=1 Tax=Nicoliella spurrieriana TaxID=2925830 RepID=A0A976RT63_9LACO|nr:nitroreductase family protein [Nicoliella spurrieriana]UQS87400.1 nitroreductase family protein [Nicoliella spurrieriana]